MYPEYMSVCFLTTYWEGSEDVEAAPQVGLPQPQAQPAAEAVPVLGQDLEEEGQECVVRPGWTVWWRGQAGDLLEAAHHQSPALTIT